MTFRQQYRSARRKQYFYTCLTVLTILAIVPLCFYCNLLWLFILSDAIGVYSVYKACFFEKKANKAKDYIVFDNFLEDLKNA